MDIGKNIREAREAQGLMVSEVARRAELTVSGVTSIESGRVRKPAVDTVVRIARALGVDPGELLKEEATPSVTALPNTPLTDTSPDDLDERLRNAGSASEVEAMLDHVRAEEERLEQFRISTLNPKLTRARIYRTAMLDRWTKLADPRFDRPFKSVKEIAQELAEGSEILKALAEEPEKARQETGKEAG